MRHRILFFILNRWNKTMWFLLASFLKICHQSDPFLDDCIMQSVVSLKPHLKNGITALGIPACEPLRLEEIQIDQISGPIYIHARYNNVSIYGGTNFVPKSIRYVLAFQSTSLCIFLPFYSYSHVARNTYDILDWQLSDRGFCQYYLLIRSAII